MQPNRLIFAGAARRAGPDSMLIVCVCMCLSEMISLPLIGQNSETFRDVARRHAM